MLLACLLIFSSIPIAAQDTTKVITPEGIGKHLSEILINRGDITHSPYAINIDRLFPDINPKDFEDSPAEFILAILLGQQIQLPISWNKILHKADSLNLNTNTTYIKTYFDATHNDQYKLHNIIQSHSIYYVLTTDLLRWEDKAYIMRIYDEFPAYKTMDELQTHLFEKESTPVLEEDFEDLPELDEEDKKYKPDTVSYSYNKSFIPAEIDGIQIKSYDSFTEKLNLALKKLTSFDKNDFALSLEDYRKIFSPVFEKHAKQQVTNSETDSVKIYYQKILANPDKPYDEYIKTSWDEIILSLKQMPDSEIKSTNIKLSNAPFWNYECYNIAVTITVEYNSEKYLFDYIAILIDNDWKFVYSSPLRENFKFQF